MKMAKILRVSSPFLISLSMAANVQAGWWDVLTGGETQEQGSQAVEKINTPVETGVMLNKAATAPAAQVQSGLTDILMQQLGVSQTQAQGGAGALFQVAKQRMAADAFGQLKQAIPGMDTMLGAVPKKTSGVSQLANGLSSLTGGNETVNTAASLISAFQQLDLSQGMVKQFTPIVVNYVKQQGGPQLANLLQLALAGS